jgi:hypothetical protein
MLTKTAASSLVAISWVFRHLDISEHEQKTDIQRRLRSKPCHDGHVAQRPSGLGYLTAKGRQSLGAEALQRVIGV